METITGAELEAYWEKLGATFVRQKGSHRFWRLPDGTMVGSLSGTSECVPSALIRLNAKNMGITYSELRYRLGAPVISKGKARHQPVKVRNLTISKSTVVEAANEVAALAEVCRARLQRGTRSQGFYEHALADLTEARQILERLEDHTKSC